MARLVCWLMCISLLILSAGIVVARQSEPQSAGEVIAENLGEGRTVYFRWRDGTGLRAMTGGPISAGGTPTAWSPDGRWLAYINVSLYIIRADRHQRARLTEPMVSAPEWSPDGRSLAYTAFREGNWDIYIMDITTREARRLTSRENLDTSPAWSPDGEWIIFTGNEGGNIDIFRVRPDGSGLQNLTITPSLNEFAPFWSPDGLWIHFQVAGGGLRRMHPDGTGKVTEDLSARDVIYPHQIPVIDLAFRPIFLAMIALACLMLARWTKF